MPEIIFDNCVLSNFALCDSLIVVKKLYSNTSHITDFVAAENVKGIQKGHIGLSDIKEAVREGWLRETSLKDIKEKAFFESLSVSLGFGEASSIAVAKVRGFVFACDDKVARREASLLGVRLTGTVGILMKAVRKRTIALNEAEILLNCMIEHGFYSPVTSIRDEYSND